MPGQPRPLEKPFASFEVLDLTRAADLTRLHDLLVPPLPKSNASESVFDHALGPGGRANPLAKTAVVEWEYVDLDHARAHDAFFTRAFVQTPRKSTRIHFFRSRFTRRTLPRLERHDREYLGFTVVRPLRVRKVGRTVMPPAFDPTETSFVTVLASTPVNLAGRPMVARGPAFMEQDERVSRCATAALWMANAALAERVGLPRYSTAEITQYATRFVVGERALPSAGLVTAQMAEALRAMGYDALNVGFSLTDPTDVWSILYAYVESGIPPMLILNLGSNGHVLTAIGHTWQIPQGGPSTTTVQWVNEPALTFHRTMSWVPEFLAHDDESGPFVKVSLQANSTSIPGIGVMIQKRQRDAGRLISYQGILQQVLIPNPAGVTLVYQEAERKAARLLKAWYGIYGGGTPPSNFVLRTYLARSNELKTSIRHAHMHVAARDIYLSKGMPRWVWVTEISDVTWVNNPAPDHQLIRGEIVLDATSSPWTLDFLAFHLIEGDDGYLSTMVPGDSDAEAAMATRWRLVGENPYEHLGRHPSFN